MAVLQSRGIFWWADEEIPQGAFAPPTAVPGLLTIEDDGRPTLDLDFLFDPSSRTQEAPEGLQRPTVLGVLRETGQRVAISQVEMSGFRLSPDGISYHTLKGWTCLLGKDSLKHAAEEASITQVKLNCTSYLEWFELGGGDFEQTSGQYEIKLSRMEDIVMPFSHGDLTIYVGISVSGLGGEQSKLNANREVYLIYVPSAPEDLKVIQGRVAAIQEFFLMQTDVLLDIEWPEVNLTGRNFPYRLYYPSNRRVDEKYSTRNQWVQFRHAKENFSKSLGEFWEKRESAKSGYFMYTGLRRNPQAPIEHKFISLVWGLEALHRRRFPDRIQSKTQADRIARIIAAVPEVKDQRWLSKQLSYSAERPLSSRLSDLIKTIPLEFSQKEFNKFCERCARVRNDISHFGMLSDHQDYNASLSEIMELIRVLTFCYHLIILIDSGIDRSYIRSKMALYMRMRPEHPLFHKYGLHPIVDEPTV